MDISTHPLLNAARAVADKVATGACALFGDDGLSFRDLLDVINPLQHIPVVGNLYRRMTGDVLDPAMRLAGGALFGGPIGAGLAAVALTIKSLGGEEVAALTPDSPAADDTRVASHRYEARGGWMVAAQRAIRVADGESPPTRALAAHAGAPPRHRAGWRVQAYGPGATPEPVRRQVDTAA